MKSWEPEDVFESADFPSRKKEEEDKERGEPKQAGQKPAEQKPTEPTGKGSGEASAENTIIRKMEWGGMSGTDGWQPERIDVNEARVIRSRREAENKTEKEATASGASAARASGNTNAGRDPRVVNGKSRAAAERKAAAFPLRLFQETVLTNIEVSLRLLRKWYFEKWPPDKNSPDARLPLKSIPPRDRVHIVLTSLGEKIQPYIFQVMSPQERARFNEIRKEDKAFSGATAGLVCREFMKGVQELSEL